MTKVYKNYINGKWVTSAGGKTFKNTNPADKDDLIGVFQASNEKDVDAALEAASSAQKMWRDTPPPKRGEIIYKAAEILKKNKEAFARDLTREMGKVITEARGDVQEAIDMGYYIAGEGRRLFGNTTTSELPNKFCMSVRMPIGTIGAITPWNFPMAIPSWKIFPAILCGNTVVFKPASDTPLTAFNFVAALEEAGLPKGVLNFITGSGRVAGTHMMKSNKVQLISFTGSTDTGREVAKICADGMKRYSLEMGGKNAIIVMDDANINLAVDGAIWGGFGTTGQRCTAASRLIVHKKVLKQFTEKLLKKTLSLKLGNGLDSSTDVGPVINDDQLKKIHAYTKIGKSEGAKLIAGGDIFKEGACQKGYFYKPTLFTEVDREMRIAREEIFGPVISIIPAANLEEAISITNDTSYGLSSAIYTKDINMAFEAVKDIYTGITYINSSTIGAEVHLPFGGTKGTGNGHREAGTTAIDIFTEWKTVYIDYSNKIQKAQIDNY